ncbi:MAG: hypothetical protein ACTSVR_06735 [Candidatus Thorarchaeota archaeon]
MGGERQGWNTWAKYLDAGIVDKTIHFTQEDVIRDHALGKTRDTIKKCWPMDAAVAYTLASAGPDADLTSREMVNVYTKMAYCMMSQMVGYGKVPDPRKESCESDMIDAVKCQWYKPKLNTQGHIVMENGDGYLDSWTPIKSDKGQKLKHLCSFRILKGEEMKFSTGIQRYFGLLMSKKYTPLRLFIENQLGSTKWAVSKSPLLYQSLTSGVCGWKDNDVFDNSDKHCSHHDKPMYEGWVMVKQVDGNGNIIPNRFVKLWTRKQHSAAVVTGWNRDQIRGKFGANAAFLAPARIVLWDTVKRSLANSVDADPKKMKACIVSINESLRRMSARNMNVVTKEGLRNTATYNWKEWKWLYNLENWIAQTSKKGRKEDDMVCPDHNPLQEEHINNCKKVGCKEGWKFTKYATKESYGHEIASFKWMPVEPPLVYYVKMGSVMKQPFGTTYSYNNTIHNHFELVFHTEAEAKRFVTYNPMMGEKTGGVGMWERIWDAEQGKEISKLSTTMTIESVAMPMEMAPDEDPEITPTPKGLLKALKFGSPQDFDAAIKYLRNPNAENYVRPKVLKKKVVMKSDEA